MEFEEGFLDELKNKTREGMLLLEKTRIENDYTKAVWGMAMQNHVMNIYIDIGIPLSQFEKTIDTLKEHYELLLKQKAEFEKNAQ